jgi:magnesium transporter
MIRSLKYSGSKVSKSLVSVGSADRLWIDASNPTAGEMKRISKLTGIYVRDIQNVLARNVLPRTIDRKNYAVVILRAMNPKKGYAPLGVFISNRFIVTVHTTRIYAVEDLFELVGKEPKEFFSKGVVYIFFRIASYVTNKFRSELDKLEDRVDKLEDEILAGKVEKPTKIFDLKGKVMNIRRALATNRDLIDVISGGYSKYLASKKQNWLSELRIEMSQVVSITELLRDRLTGAMEMYMSSISNKLNDIMRGFTVIASLVLVPTLISGIWGMNFAKIPFFDNAYGFYVPLLFMLISIALLTMWLKKKKWM